MDTFLLSFLLIIFLVLMNGFFVAAEFAMVKARNTRIDQLASEGNNRAKYARKITANLDAYLSACQLGITIASLGLGWAGEPIIADWLIEMIAFFGWTIPAALLHTISFVIAFSAITFFHIVLGELAPKSLAIQRSESVTLWTAPLLVFFYRLMYPFIWFLNGTANRTLKLFGIPPVGEHDAAHTEDEIRILMEQSHRSGLIDKTEIALVDKIFEFSDRIVREIMIPRPDMVVLYKRLSFDENFKIAQEEKHTRFPLCGSDKDDILGFIHVKDLYELELKEGVHKLSSIIRPVLTVPESMPVSKLLRLMQRKRCHIAIVIDEYGGTAGLITIEDILEEIVGEIQDEFDEERPAIEKLAGDEYSIDGRLLIEELNDYLNLDLNSEDNDTIGGWVYSRLETTPSVGMKVKQDDYEFEISEVDHLRISRIKVRRLNGGE